MAKSIGVVVTDRIAAGVVDGSTLIGSVRTFPPEEDDDVLFGLPYEEICSHIAEQVVAAVEAAGGAGDATSLGLAVPGIVRAGVVEDSPNLTQLKGGRLAEAMAPLLAQQGLPLTVTLLNDADAVAHGIAATRNKGGKLVRVWTIGNGIGFGRAPWAEGVWEGGHTVVTLDPKENYCGCGGVGHLEGIMGYRAMRLRFLDMEPEEVFAEAKNGDARCLEFVELWHRALAAATASAIHVAGPGPFYYTGRNIEFLEIELLKTHLHDMVKMSPLQSYSLEVLEANNETSIIGAAAAAVLRSAKLA